MFSQVSVCPQEGSAFPQCHGDAPSWIDALPSGWMHPLIMDGFTLLDGCKTRWIPLLCMDAPLLCVDAFPPWMDVPSLDEMDTPPPKTDGQQAGGPHRTGMHTCCISNFM